MLIFLTILLIILTVWGGGIFPPALFIAAALLSSAAIYTSMKTDKCGGLLAHFSVLLIAYLIVTAVPLPLSISGMLHSGRSEQNRLAHDAVTECVDIGLVEEASPAFSISRNRSGTIRIILLLICFCVYAALSSQMELHAKLSFIRTAIALGVLIAAGGFISQWIIPQQKSIWWTFKVDHGRPVGCFINRNHFGGYLAMLSPAALVMAVSNWKVNRKYYSALYVLAFVTMSFAVISSLSRGAWVAWISSVLITTIILTKTARSHRIITALLCIVAISSAIALGLNSREDVSDRFATFENIAETPSANMRFTTWKDSIKIIPDYLLLGTGANGFRMIFPQYRTDSSRKEFKHVENEYIQTPVETGIIGTLMIITLAFLFFKRWLSLYTPASQEENIIATCMLGAVSAAAVHGIFDFSIRVPLYAITLAGISGIAIKPLRKTADQKRTYNKPEFLYAIAGLILSTFLFVSEGPQATQLDSPDNIKTASTHDLCQALSWAPTSWQAWYHIGNQSISSGLPGSYEFGEKCIEQAVVYDPLNYRLLKQLCLVKMHGNDIDGAKETYKRLKTLRSWVKIPELE